MKVFNLIVLKYQVLSSTECWILNLNICGSCIHCQLVSKWDISALSVRTLFVVTDLFIQFAHVKSVHAHSKINNALLDSTVCAQCCADQCVPLSLKETDLQRYVRPYIGFKRPLGVGRQ